MKIVRYILPLVFRNKLSELTYFVTDRCNYRCKHCFMIDELNKSCDELTSDEIRKMGKYISSMQRVHIGGGEPYLRKDLSEIAITISNSWNTAVVCTPTNGWNTEGIQSMVQEFGKNCKKILRIHFSLNALDNEMDEFCNKKGAFNKIAESIYESKKISKQYPHISLIALMTYNDYNQGNFKELMDYAKNVLKVDDISIQLARSHGIYKPTLDINKFESILQNEFKYSGNHSTLLINYRRLVREATADYERNPRMIVPCKSGKMRAVMAPNGDIYPCEHLGYPNGSNATEWLMGNIRDFDYDIYKLLKSKQSKQIQNRILKNQCHCSHGIDMALNLLASNQFKIKVLYYSLSSSLVSLIKDN
jgi:radical SAM protein with 4Fe4S-binding SPASM domain